MDTKIFNYPCDSNIINYCVDKIKKGGIGIFPTDTVYGIGCDCLNIQALQDLYNIKNRSLTKPINILVSNINMLNDFVKDIDNIEQKLMDTFWPGALTIVFDKSELIPDILTANLDTIGIRMPNNKICLDIINKFKKPLAMSSANIADKLPDNNLKHLLQDFNNKVDFIIDSGPINFGIPSTIVKVKNNEIIILRKGSITKEELVQCFGGNINVR